MMKLRSPRVADCLVIALLTLATVLLWRAPGPRSLVDRPDPQPVKAKVLATDDSDLMPLGHAHYGEQKLTVELSPGDKLPGFNHLRGQLELDKTFQPGDTAMVVVREDDAGEGARVASALDHWRLDRMVWFFAAFAVVLVIFGGATGLRALFTFLFSCLAVWKILVKYALEGYGVALVSFLTVLVLTAAIIFLVAGMSRKGLAAFLGSILGVIASFALAKLAVAAMNINAATIPYSQALLNLERIAGLDLSDIFIGAIVLAASGAVMDLAMDIAAGVDEVRRHNPTLGFWPLFASGIRIGRSVVGTMTTTLLLAYSGGYLTLLMCFAAEGRPPLYFINSTVVSAEVAKTLVGSFGLLLVAPFTALVSAAIYRRKSV